MPSSPARRDRQEGGARGRERDRQGQLSRAAARHPVRGEGHLRHGRRPDVRTFAHLHRSRAATRRDGGQQAAGGRRGADGQARDARVRARRAVLRSALAAGAQSLEHGTFHGRLVVGLGRGARGGAGAGQASDRIPAARSAVPPACAASPGLKPTYGLVSRAGVLPNSYSFDHCGPMARTSEDCALILNAIAGHDPADPASSHAADGRFRGRPRSRRQGTAHRRRPPFLGKGSARARRAGRGTGGGDRACSATWAPIVEDVRMRPLQAYSDVKIVMAESELFSLHLPELIARPQDFGQDFRARSLAACLFTAEDYVRASRERRTIMARDARALSPLRSVPHGQFVGRAAPRPARRAVVLEAAEPDLAVQLHRRTGARRAVRLHAARACRCRCRSPADRSTMRACWRRPRLRAGQRMEQAASQPDTRRTAGRRRSQAVGARHIGCRAGRARQGRGCGARRGPASSRARSWRSWSRWRHGRWPWQGG